MKKLLLYILIPLTALPIIAMKRTREQAFEKPAFITLFVQNPNALIRTIGQKEEEYESIVEQMSIPFTITRSTAEKIPFIKALIEEVARDKIPLSDQFEPKTIKFVIDVVENTYMNAPILFKDPQFFDTYTPADIPLQITNEMSRLLEKYNLKNELALAKIIKTAQYFGLEWITDTVSRFWVASGFTLAQAEQWDLRQDVINFHIKKYYDNQNLLYEQSIADMVAYNTIPQPEENINETNLILNLANKNISSLAGIHILSKMHPLITRLHLENNHITTVPGDAFANFKNLRRLYLDNNQINSIGNNAFANLNKLKRLLLDNNQITTISDNLFANLTNLVWLHLENNQITTITPSAFTKLSSLQYLYLQNNNISTIHAGLFAHLDNLILLYLNDNQITIIAAGAFVNLGELEELHLDDNQITTIPLNTFSNHYYWLHLDGNKLSQAEKDRLRTALPEVEIKF